MFEPTTQGPLWDHIGTTEGLSAIVRCMAEAFDPDWGIVGSQAYWDSLSPEPKLGEFVGWLNYYPKRRGTVPPLPAPVRIEPVGDLGTLVILTPEQFSATNSEHVALATRVTELLKRAGLLESLFK